MSTTTADPGHYDPDTAPFPEGVYGTGERVYQDIAHQYAQEPEPDHTPHVVATAAAHGWRPAPVAEEPGQYLYTLTAAHVLSRTSRFYAQVMAWAHWIQVEALDGDGYASIEAPTLCGMVALSRRYVAISPALALTGMATEHVEVVRLRPEGRREDFERVAAIFEPHPVCANCSAPESLEFSMGGGSQCRACGSRRPCL